LISSLELSNDSKKLWSSCRHCMVVIIVIVNATGADDACGVVSIFGRRTVFVAKFSKFKEEFIKAHSKFVPLLRRGQSGCGIGRLWVSDVIVDSVDDGGIEKG